MIEYVCKASGLKAAAQSIPAGVELLRRVNGKSEFLFVLNHSGGKVNIPIDGHGRDLLTGAEILGSIELESSGVAVIQMN